MPDILRKIRNLTDKLQITPKSFSVQGAQKKPAFIIIGAQKSGTTSLYHWLPQHPNIVMSKSEEPHYFDRDDRYPDHAWYRAQFSVEGTGKSEANVIFGEKSPIYCFWPTAIPRIFEYDKDIKLIMILRSPIDRAVSQYWMEVNRNDETLPINEAFEREEERLKNGEDRSVRKHSYLARGRYHEQLQRVYQYFPRHQLLVCRYEDMVKDPHHVLDQMTDYFGLPRFRFQTNTKHRVGNYPQIDDELRNKLRAYYAPHNAILTENYGIYTGDWS